MKNDNKTLFSFNASVIMNKGINTNENINTDMSAKMSTNANSNNWHQEKDRLSGETDMSRTKRLINVDDDMQDKTQNKMKAETVIETAQAKAIKATKTTSTTSRLSRWLKTATLALSLILASGISYAATISGKVYLDYDDSGSNIDLPLAGLTVELFDSTGATAIVDGDGTPITTITSSDGGYTLDNSSINTATDYTVKVSTSTAGEQASRTTNITMGATSVSNVNIWLKGSGGSVVLTIKDSYSSPTTTLNNFPVVITSTYINDNIATDSSGEITLNNLLTADTISASLDLTHLISNTNYALWSVTNSGGNEDYVNQLTFTANNASATQTGSFNIRPRNTQTLSGLVAMDQNEDGGYTSGIDTLMSNIDVKIYYQGTSTEIINQTTSTTVDGKYQFSDLPLGDYTIAIYNLNSDYQASSTSSTGISTDYSLSQTSTSPSLPSFLLDVSGTSLPGISGYVFGLSSTGYVDRGPDSNQTAGVAGNRTRSGNYDAKFQVPVTLQKYNGASWDDISSYTSTIDGYYSFKALDSGGNYRVKIDETPIVNAGGYIFMNDSDGKSTHRSSPITGTIDGKQIDFASLTSFKTEQNFWYSPVGTTTIFFSNYMLTAQGSVAWGGTINGLSGTASMGTYWKAEIYEEDGQTPVDNGSLITTTSTSLNTTASYGTMSQAYRTFSSLTHAGVYAIKMIDYPSEVTYSVDSNGISYYALTSVAGRSDGNRTLVALYPAGGAGSVTGRVFYDKDDNNSYSSIDIDAYSASVDLYREVNGTYTYVSRVGTKTDGTYLFTNLPEGKYQVRVNGFSTASNLNTTDYTVAGNSPDDTHSATSLADNIITNIIINTGTDTSADNDFLYKLNVSSLTVKGAIYLDTYGTDNTVQVGASNNMNDFYLPDVTVLLCETDNTANCYVGSPSVVITSYVTSSNGSYQFTGLVKNTNYVVTAIKTGTTAVTNGELAGAYNIIFDETNSADLQAPIVKDFLMQGDAKGVFSGRPIYDLNGNAQYDSNEYDGNNTSIFYFCNVVGSCTSSTDSGWKQFQHSNVSSGNNIGRYESYFNIYNLPEGRYMIQHANSGKYLIADKDPETNAGTVIFDVDSAGNITNSNAVDITSKVTAVSGINSGYFYTAKSYSVSEGVAGQILLDVTGSGNFNDAVPVPVSKLAGTTVSGYYTARYFQDTVTTADKTSFVNPNFTSTTTEGGVNYFAYTTSTALAPTGGVYLSNFILSLNGLSNEFTLVDNSSDTKNTDVISSSVDISDLKYMQINPGTSGRTDLYWLVKLTDPAVISGTLYYDANSSGDYNSGDEGVNAGVVVNLYEGSLTTTSGANIYASTTTDANGNYTFNNLFTGDYTVEVTSTGLHTDYILVDASSKSDTATSGSTTTLNFQYGKALESSVSGYVLIDINDDGEADVSYNNTGDIAYENATVTLYKGSIGSGTLQSSVQTSATGLYYFKGLDENTDYYVTLASPSGYGIIKSYDGTSASISDTLDASIGATATQITGQYFLLAGRTNSTPSAGNGSASATSSGIAGNAYELGTTIAISGEITVGLYDSTGKLLVKQQTRSGNYHFYNLDNGAYTVKAETEATGYALVGNEAGSSPYSEMAVTLSNSGTLDRHFYYSAASEEGIKGSVYVDLLNDTILPSTNMTDDIGLTGVKVELYSGYDASGSSIATTYTDSNGAYQFKNLLYGNGVNYSVKISPASQYVAKESYSGDGVPTTSSDAAIINIANLPQTGFTGNDFTLIGQRAIGGHVWIDATHTATNSSTIPSTNDIKGGVKVTLTYKTSANGNYATYTSMNTQTTDGSYKFEYLPEGWYYKVSVDSNDSNLANTTLVDTSIITNNNDSFANEPLGNTDVSGLISIYRYDTTISGQVIVDIDGDNALSSVDANVVALDLVITNGTISRTVQTDSEGKFSATNFAPDTWKIALATSQSGSPLPDVSNSANYTLTFTKDSSGTLVSASPSLPIDVIVTTTNLSHSGIVLGYQGQSSIKGYVVIDSNNDGAYTSTDGVFGLLSPVITPKLTLSGATGFTSRDITVNATTGAFEVNGLDKYDYVLTLDSDNAISSKGYSLKFSPTTSVTTTSPSAAVTFPVSGPNDTTYSATPADQTFGYVNNRTISGKVYLDMGGNQEYKDFHLPLDGATVTATNGTLTRTQTVGSNGEFSLGNITEGTWVVSVSHPTRSNLVYSYYAEVALTPDSSTTSNNITYVVDSTTLSEIKLNLGMMGQSSVAGKIVYDLDVSETPNTGDEAIVGLTVKLTDKTDATKVYNTVTTDGSGEFILSNLSQGDYAIRVIDSDGDLLKGYVISFSPSGKASENTATTVEDVTLATDSTALTAQNFGYKGNSGISGNIYQDLLGNGTHYSDNSTLGGVTVSAVNGGATLTATSASDGSYEIDGLTPDASWTIQITTYPSTDWQYSYVNYSDSVMSHTTAGVVTLAIPPDGNTSGYALDFGAKGSATISGKVVIDMDVSDNATNNYQAATIDVPLNNIKVALTVNGHTLETTTNSTGEYQFNALAIASYGVSVDTTNAQLSGYDISFSPALAASGGTGTATSADTIAVAALNSSMTNMDYGYKSQGSLVGTIYQDYSGKGVHQTYHGKLAGAKVKAVNVANNSVELYSTISDTNGEYVIENMAAGKWTITIDTYPSGYNYSYLGTTVGSTGTQVSQGVEVDIDPTTQSQEQADFGMKGSAKIEGQVVIDVDDSDGTSIDNSRDIGIDAFVSHYTVKIYVDNDLVNSSEVNSTTNPGEYSFTNLSYGVEYKVVAEKPDGFTYSFINEASYIADSSQTGSHTADEYETYKFISATDIASGANFAWKGAGGISGDVFLDVNDDGGDFVVGIDSDVGAALTVTLTYKDTSKGVSTLTKNITSGNTFYEFTGVLSGDWVIEVSGVPTTLRASFDPDDGYDANSLPNSTRANKAEVTIGSTALDKQHFGYINGGIISGIIKEDSDGTGLSYAGNHNPLKNVSVYLLDDSKNHVSSGSELTTVSVTDDEGKFSFRNLAIDAYGGSGITHHIRVLYGEHHDGTIGSSSSDPLYERLPYYEAYTDIGGTTVSNDLIDVLTAPSTIDHAGTGGTHTIPVVLTDTTQTNHSSLSRVGDVLDMVLGYRAADSDVTIVKTAHKDNVVVGDIVPYTIRIINNTNATASLKIKDALPPGFQFVSGSGRFNGEKIANPTGGRTVYFGPFSIAANSEATLSYMLVVGSGVTQGEYVNTAVAVGALTNNAISNTSQATVTVTNDPLFEDALIFGKVYIDKNGNGIQDFGEEGLGGVKLVTVRGEIITTDQYGRYHIVGVSGGRWERGTNFVLKLDPRSLPKGYKVIGRNPQVIRLSPGLPSKLDFKIDDSAVK